jgi:hypothetical protein
VSAAEERDLPDRTRERWWVESWDGDEWMPCTSPSGNRSRAEEKQAGVERRHPGILTRIVKETTSWTIDMPVAVIVGEETTGE